MNNENENKMTGTTQESAGNISATYKKEGEAEKIEPWSWEEGTFPPPREEDAPPEHMAPPPVIDLPPEEAAPASDPEGQEAKQAQEEYFRNHPKEVSPDYMEAITSALLNGSNMAAYMASGFDDDIEKTAAQEGIQTGFENLDNYTGGIDPALYVIGAGTGLGKTTFCLQMADNIAASGRDVIYIALEQTPFELATKSISRLAAQISGNKTTEDGEIITSKKIRKKTISKEMRPIYEQAKERYFREIAPRMNIIHFGFHTGATEIIKAVDLWRERRKEITGAETMPVVFVD